MTNDLSASDAFSFAELNYLRLEAMDLFERCLTEGRSRALETFIEEQISQEPPRLDLLREVADDLHQRLLTLRENQFDVRDRVLRTLRDDYHLDLSPLLPLQALDTYHLLDVEEALSYVRRQINLSHQDEAVVRKTLDASCGAAAQINQDVKMTESLYDYIMDWVLALHAPAVRRTWTEMRPARPSNERIH